MHDFLVQFIAGDLAHVAVVAVVVGGAVFALIQAIDALIKQSGQPLGLSPDLKFWGALVLSLVIPFAAYFIDSLSEQQPITWNGVFLAGAVAFTAATALHWITGGSSNAKAAQQVFAPPDVPPSD